jgi:PTH1 family peptidyl-tRNA hydrolase
MKLVIGLGNPGKKYEQTLHNAGVLVLDAVVTKQGLSWSAAPKNIPAVIAKSGSALYAKPTTYMNESGRAVQQLLAYYACSPADLIVVHDDIDLMMGDVREDTDRGAGGHNGIRSVIEALGGDKSFRRVRVGIATERTAQKEGKKRDVAKIALKKPGFFDRKAFTASLGAGAEAVLRAIE